MTVWMYWALTMPFIAASIAAVVIAYRSKKPVVLLIALPVFAAAAFFIWCAIGNTWPETVPS